MTITWVDDVTQLDAAHMNQLEQTTRKGIANGYASLGADGIVPTAQLPPIPPLVLSDADIPPSIARDAEVTAALTAKVDIDTIKAAGNLVRTRLLAGDTQSIFRIDYDGAMAWGQGGATAADTFLQRTATGELFSNIFRAQTLRSNDIVADYQNSGAKLYFGSALGTNLYSPNPAVLRTDGQFIAASLVTSLGGVDGRIALKVDIDAIVPAATRLVSSKFALGDTQAFRIMGNGDMQWGPGGGVALDTLLFRQGVANLRVQGTLDAQALTINGVPVGTGSGGITSIGDTTPSTLTGLLKGNGTDVDVAVAGTDYATPGTVNTGLGLKVDKDSVVVAATRIVASKLLAGDTQPAFQINGLGTLQWGPGGATALDTDLYRFGGSLRTSQVMYADLGFTARNNVSAARVDVGLDSVKASLLFGSDTNLYRAAASRLKSDTQIESATEIVARQGNAAMQVYIGQATGAAGGVVFGTAGDTNLYRSNAAQLMTDGQLVVAEAFYGKKSVFVDYSNGGYRLYFGNAADTSLYRSAVNQLQTDGWFHVGGADPFQNTQFSVRAPSAAYNVFAAVIAGDAQYRFSINGGGLMSWGTGGGTQDTNLYRSAAGLLKTDGKFRAGGEVLANDTLANQITLGGDGKIYFGNAYDTNLYRAAASVLKTDGHLKTGISMEANAGAAGSVFVGYTPAGGYTAGISFGSTQDTNLYRSAAGVLQTDGVLNVLTQGASGTLSSLGLGFRGVGSRVLEVGAADSAGAGYRMVRITN